MIGYYPIRYPVSGESSSLKPRSAMGEGGFAYQGGVNLVLNELVRTLRYVYE